MRKSGGVNQIAGFFQDIFEILFLAQYLNDNLVCSHFNIFLFP